ncbi:MAG: P-loop NTPase fold protein [Bryobacterales bacterium]|nr:P-loop NTPase fold protein [Bryobacterales bacterium]
MISIDHPIHDARDDALGRTEPANSFVRYALALDATEGAVVGVFGPWGSGKTSFINLARQEFKRRGFRVLDFNPWLFSGSEQLVERFFAELSDELKLADLVEVGKALDDYGKALGGALNLAIGTIGIVVSVSTAVTGLATLIADLSTAIISGIVVAGIAVLLLEALGKTLRRRQSGIPGLRKKVEEALRKRNKPIFIVLDDVDRLSVAEIRDVFKLVRLTASFPNLVYIVACDRLQVAKALSELGVSGHDYLEKIIQLPFDLPAAPNELLEKQLEAAIGNIVDGTENPGPLDRQAWEAVAVELVRPLIRNMRDVRRYAASTQKTLAHLDGQVALADVLGLEAVRIFLPGVFSLLPATVNALTVTSVGHENMRHIRTQSQTRTGISTEPELRFKEQVAELIKSGNNHDVVVRALIVHLFPVGRRYMPSVGAHPHVGSEDSPYDDEWAVKRLQERRVVHEHVLRVYLEHTAGSNILALHDAEHALELMADDTALEDFLRSMVPDRFVAVLDHLRTFADRFRPEHVESGSAILLNLLDGMPRQPGGSLRDAPQMLVGLVIDALLGTLKEPAAIEAGVRRILTAIRSLSSKVLLIDRIRRSKQDAQPLVSSAATREFGRLLSDEIRSASVDDLVQERDILRVLVFAKGLADSGAPFDVPDSPRLTLVLLRFYDINTLSTLYGDKATLKARFEDLNASFEDLKPWIKEKGISLDEAKQVLDQTSGELNK